MELKSVDNSFKDGPIHVIFISCKKTPQEIPGVVNGLSLCADPMQNVVQVLEKQYLEEKRTALEEQRMMYERELESLRQQLSPEKTAPPHHGSGERLAFPAPHAAHSKLRLWTEERSLQNSYLTLLWLLYVACSDGVGAAEVTHDTGQNVSSASPQISEACVIQ